MRVLFVGGTGLISRACTLVALAHGMEVTHLNRGTRTAPPRGVHTLVADVRDEDAATAALGGRDFDAVVDFVAYRPEDVERDLRLFGGRTGHLVVVSTATVYAKPHATLPVREDWPLGNAFWAYARDKQACEERLFRAVREDGIVATVVRPSHTYGDGSIPLAVRSLDRPYTSVARLRAGKPLIVPGDGTSLWTLTHVDDAAVGIVGLLGQASASGHAFNVTSDEAMSWDEIHREVAAAAGAPLHAVHLPSAFLAEAFPDLAGRLLGDATVSSVFDSGKLARWVPDFRPAVRFAEGIRRSIAWFDADPRRQAADAELDARWDAVIEAWERGLDTARVHLGARA